MGVEPEKIQQAMRSVTEAHEVLAEFHKEIVAFYGIVDEQLADAHGPVKLEPHMDGYIVRYPADKLKAPQDWVPKWIGRFYRDIAAESGGDDEDDAAKATQGKDADEGELNVAFVWIAAHAPADEAPDCSTPECWFGVAHPGVGSGFKDSWSAARYGVWYKLDTCSVLPGRWVEGEFSESGKFGKGGRWHARRVPLVELLDEERIRSLVTDPLRKKYAEVFAAGG
ncbi:hypothetical protein WMF20_32210 [Sorangium sp. So ce834]|uniref:hypothetical protein n=1 Tax=Sorangium sp. So ce834 TaxID=3133321 RepID=UPI003F633E42